MALRFKKSGSGIDLCRRIRNLDQNAPVVFVSAAAYNSDHRKAMAAGATAYLDKPVDPWVLEQTVTRLIKQVEARSLEARIMEINAIREAISDHLSGLAERSAQLRKQVAVANDHLLKAQAYNSFTAAGGTRAYFDRFWPGCWAKLSDFVWALFSLLIACRVSIGFIQRGRPEALKLGP